MHSNRRTWIHTSSSTPHLLAPKTALPSRIDVCIFEPLEFPPRTQISRFHTQNLAYIMESGPPLLQIELFLVPPPSLLPAEALTPPLDLVNSMAHPPRATLGTVQRLATSGGRPTHVAPRQPPPSARNEGVLALLSPEKLRLRPDDLGFIVDWLENPENFNSLHGGNRRTKVAGKFRSKKTVFNCMLIQLHDVGFPDFVRTGVNLGARMTRYMRRYKDANIFLKDTGSGLTAAETDAGLTLDDKLEKMCPHFHRMHAMFGERANIEPPAIACLGFPNDSQFATSLADDDELAEDDDDDDTPRSPTFSYAGVPDPELMNGTTWSS